MKEIGTIIMALLFAVIGHVVLFHSEKIQKYYVGYYESNQNGAKLNPFLNWMKSPNYIMSLRIIGILCILAFVLLVYIIAKRWLGY